jgi:hypothetical protein
MPATRALLSLLHGMVTSGKQTLQLKLMYSIRNPSKHTDEVM